MFDGVSGWRDVRLGDICSLAIGGTPSRDVPEYWSDEGNGYAWASISDLKSPIISDTKEYISTAGIRNSNVKLVPNGTVIMSFKLTIGRTAIAGKDIYTNEAIAAFFPGDSITRDFLYYWLPFIASTADTDLAIKGATLNKKKLADLTGLLPPLDEQRRIAEVLRSVDEALIAEQKALAQIVALKNSAIEHFIGEATRVEPISLGEIISSMDAGWSPNCENAPALRGEWGILKTSAVTWTGYHDEQNKRLPKTLEPRPLLSVDLGDILITRAGPAERTGVVAMVDETVGRRMLSDKLIRIRVNPKRASARTVATILGSSIVQAQIDRVKSGMAASQTNISQKIVSDLLIPLPPLESQLKFATFMDTMIRKVKDSVAQLEHLTDLKNKLAGDLLSGRVRVPA